MSTEEVPTTRSDSVTDLEQFGDLIEELLSRGEGAFALSPDITNETTDNANEPSSERECFTPLDLIIPDRNNQICGSSQLLAGIKKPRRQQNRPPSAQNSSSQNQGPVSTNESPKKRKRKQQQTKKDAIGKTMFALEELRDRKSRSPPSSKSPVTPGSSAFEPFPCKVQSSPLTVNTEASPTSVLSPRAPGRASLPASLFARALTSSGTGASPAQPVNRSNSFGPNHHSPGRNFYTDAQSATSAFIPSPTPTSPQGNPRVFYPNQTSLSIPSLSPNTHDAATSVSLRPAPRFSPTPTLPSGTEICIPDDRGRPRWYKVGYTVQRMTKEEAVAYFRQSAQRDRIISASKFQGGRT